MKGILLLAAHLLVALAALLPAVDAGHAQARRDDRIRFHGQDLWLSGGNVAWVRFARDIGPDETSLELFDGMFRELSESGGNTFRLWLHTDGSHTPEWRGDTVVGPGKGAVADLRGILDRAEEHGIGLILCLWSFDMLRTSVGAEVTDRSYALLTQEEKLQAYIGNALVPLVAGVKDHPAILAWEIFNEPEGMSQEFGWSFNRHVPMSAIQRFINRTAGAIKRTDPGVPVTNGSWSFRAASDVTSGLDVLVEGRTAGELTGAELERVRRSLSSRYGYDFSAEETRAVYDTLRAWRKNVNYYTDERLIAAGGDRDGTLDFYTVHYYGWGLPLLSPFHHDKGFWGLDKPLVVAEFYMDDAFGVGWQQLYPTLHARGYAGALGWQWYDAHARREGISHNWPRVLESTRHMRDVHAADVLRHRRAGPAADEIRLNQVGYYPGEPKVAFVLGEAGDTFYVEAADGREVVLTGRLGAPRATPVSSDTTRAADFSALQRPGSYRVVVPGVGSSHPFEVRPRVYGELARAALKAFYFQRASMALEPRFAGPWSRPAGHPDTLVLVHPSAASRGRPAGTVISSPGGWYDAGDYNKYVVNSGITVATLLSLYEDFPAAAAALGVGTPDSGDGVPDLLQEALWNLRWMSSMQDPEDGGVYHKLTEAQFSGFEMPHEVTSPRYVVQKSTAAALNFAAVMAQASRVLRPFEEELSVSADSLLDSAVRAWSWARRNPEVVYDQDRLNERFDPDIATGAYGDGDLRDEFIWAAAELYATTGQDSFYTAVPLFADSAAPVPAWAQVRTLAYYTLVRSGERLPERARADLPRAERALVRAAAELVEGAERSAYRTPMGGRTEDFIWGSSSVAANQGIVLLAAYRLTGDRTYLRHALANMDYLLGRNATGYSFVTGFGGRTPLHPHHRPSAADGVEAPVPGMLVGGPNAARQDRGDCEYPFTEPDRAFVDHLCSYASNEIAINWNAPLVYIVTAVEALQPRAGLTGAER